MKILFYCDTVFSYGGVQRVLAEIAGALSETNDVTILTTDNDADFSMYGYNKSMVGFDFISYPSAKSLKNSVCKGYSFLYKNILPQTKFNSGLYSRSFFLPAYKKKLIEKINGGGYDVVIGVHVYLSLHLASVRKKIHSRLVLGWMHNSYEAFFEKENPYLPRLKKFFKYEMAGLDKIVVLSHIDRKKYEEHLGLAPEVIYNPLTIEVKGRADLQSKRMLSIGRFSKGHKGFDVLIKAFARFSVEYVDWELDIVGEGPEEKWYRSLIEDNDLEDRVHIHPFTKEIHRHYLQSAVYVLSSRWEGMPLVLMEAMAYGLPVIASDIPICRELLEGKEMAVLFKAEDVEDLAARLIYMAAGADRKGMSDRAITYAGCFKTDGIVEQWKKIVN